MEDEALGGKDLRLGEAIVRDVLEIADVRGQDFLVLGRNKHGGNTNQLDAIELNDLLRQEAINDVDGQEQCLGQKVEASVDLDEPVNQNAARLPLQLVLMVHVVRVRQRGRLDANEVVKDLVSVLRDHERIIVVLRIEILHSFGVDEALSLGLHLHLGLFLVLDLGLGLLDRHWFRLLLLGASRILFLCCVNPLAYGLSCLRGTLLGDGGRGGLPLGADLTRAGGLGGLLGCIRFLGCQRHAGRARSSSGSALGDSVRSSLGRGRGLGGRDLFSLVDLDLCCDVGLIAQGRALPGGANVGIKTGLFGLQRLVGLGKFVDV